MINFETYILELIKEENEAIQSRLPPIIKRLKASMGVFDLVSFVDVAKRFVRNDTVISNESKVDIINGIEKASAKGKQGIIDYLEYSTEFYNRGGFVDPRVMKQDTIKYYNREKDYETNDDLHYGDIVKYIGPPNSEIYTDEHYMIVQRSEIQGKGLMYRIKMFNMGTGQLRDEREFAKTVNPRFLKFVGNNLKRRRILKNQQKKEDSYIKRWEDSKRTLR
jgi:hypothetical protein